MRKLMLVLAAMTLLSTMGCVSAGSGTGRTLDLSDANRLQVGQTSTAEATAIFGPPTTTINSKDGITYSSWIGPLVGSKFSALSIVFDKEGKIEQYSTRTSIIQNGKVAQHTEYSSKYGPVTYSGEEYAAHTKDIKECGSRTRGMDDATREQRMNVVRECMRGKGYTGPRYEPVTSGAGTSTPEPQAQTGSEAQNAAPNPQGSAKQAAAQTVAKQTAQTATYADKSVSMALEPVWTQATGNAPAGYRAFTLRISNLSAAALQLSWDSSSFVENGEDKAGFSFKGIRYADREAPKKDLLVPPGATVTMEITPNSKVTYVQRDARAEQTGMPTGWVHGVMEKGAFGGRFKVYGDKYDKQIKLLVNLP